MPSDLVLLAVNLGLLVAVFAIGYLIGRRTRVDARRRALPGWQQFLIAVVAFSPLFVLLQREVDVWILDGSVVAIAAYVALWVGLHLVVSSLLDVDPVPRPDC